MKLILAISAFVLLKTVISASVETANQDLVIDNLERTINLESQLVKITSKITLLNNGKGATKGFHYAVEEAFVPNLAFIGATVRTYTFFRIELLQ